MTSAASALQWSRACANAGERLATIVLSPRALGGPVAPTVVAAQQVCSALHQPFEPLAAWVLCWPCVILEKRLVGL